MRYKQPTPEQEQLWKEWIAERPKSLHAVAQRFDPWTLYRMKSTGQRVFLMALSEPGPVKCDWCKGTGGPVPPGDDPCNNCSGSGKVEKFTCRVGVSGEFNLVTHERAVFGVDVDDLEECDLPGPDELLGTMELPIDVIKHIHAEYPNGPTKGVLAQLMLKYPLKPGGGGG